MIEIMQAIAGGIEFGLTWRQLQVRAVSVAGGLSVMLDDAVQFSELKMAAAATADFTCRAWDEWCKMLP